RSVRRRAVLWGEGGGDHTGAAVSPLPPRNRPLRSRGGNRPGGSNGLGGRARLSRGSGECLPRGLAFVLSGRGPASARLAGRHGGGGHSVLVRSMATTRVVLMGAPTYFSIRAGANPHTRTAWGRRKSVERDRAIAQWHAFARLLGGFGVRVLVVPADPLLTGLVYPANAGFLFPLDEALPVSEKTFYLSNLLPPRAADQPVYDRFLTRCGFCPAHLQPRFEGEADFFPVGGRYLFPYGRVENQRFRFRLGLPPYERVYGFRSESAALAALQQIVADREVVPLE